MTYYESEKNETSGLFSSYYEVCQDFEESRYLGVNIQLIYINEFTAH